MRTKEKLSITIDGQVIEALDKVSKELQVAKSSLAQQALELWLKKRTEDLMAEGYLQMAEDDKKFADMTLEAQAEILS